MHTGSIVPVILAGGQGRRLRPLTSIARPKPFLKMFSGLSLLQHTLRRLDIFSAPVIVTGRHFAMAALDDALEIEVEPMTVIAEPFQRGTAPALALAAFYLPAENPLLVMTPSDHIIDDEESFRETLRRAASIAAGGEIVLLGKTPENPAARYGYMRTNGEAETLRLESFIEKPDAFMAKALCRMPGVFWNTGIFICRARHFLDLLQAYTPDVFASALHAFEHGTREDLFFYPDFDSYGAAPEATIDRALMEHLREARVLSLETGWHDVGCWERLVALKVRAFVPLSKKSG